MSKKTALISFIGLFIILGITSVLLGVFSSSSNTTTISQSQTASPTPYAQSTLSFSPTNATISNTRTTDLTIDLDTAENSITGVQLEIVYDPDVFTNVTLKPGTFLPQAEVLINKTDKMNGRITYALVLPISQKAVKGKGIIATMTLTQTTTLPKNTKAESTIHLLPSTLVTAEGIRKSVLKTAGTTKIKLYSSNPGSI